MKRCFAVIAVALTITSLSEMVGAATITGVNINDFSSQLSGFGGRFASDTISGTGFIEGTGVHDTNAANMWLTDGPFEADEGNDTVPSHISFDLGANYDLNSFKVWNYNENPPNLTNRGAKDVTVSVASTVNGAFTAVGNFVFNQAPATASDFGQVIDLSPFGAADDTRVIRLDITTNHGDAAGVVGLSEIRFDGDIFGPERIFGVTATATSELTAGNFNRAVGNIVDNVGLDTTTPDGLPGQPEGMWLSTGTGIAGGTPDPAPEIIFDLGAIENIGEMHVYNYNEAAGELHERGVEEVEILVSNDNFFGDTRSLGVFNFDIATGLPGLAGQIIDLGGAQGQFVKFDIISSHNGDNGFVGLNEVQFFRANAVPEPATALLGLMGLAGLTARRRRAA